MNKTKILDPRAALLILFFSSIITFAQKSIFIELSYLFFLSILLSRCDCKKQVLKWIGFFCTLIIFQYALLPVAPKFIATAFTILAVYSRKMVPCLMMGTLVVKTIPVHYIILAMRKWHFPEKLIIPLSITIRYIPTIREEYHHIRNSMKLREIKGIQKFECIIVSLTMSATNTADELSAAAITRGIENPCKKTSAFSISLKFFDYLYLIIAMIFVIFTFIL